MSTDQTGSIGTVTVNVSSTNVETFDLKIPVVARNKLVPVPDGEISATAITCGDTLSRSTVTGRMKDAGTTGEEIKGTFAWTDGTVTPNAGSYEAEWTFTPDASYEEYAPAAGKVTITVNPKSIEGAIVTLKQDSFLKVSGWSVDAVTGKVAYTLSGGAAGDTVTLPVTVTSTNYADTVVNVVITLTERDDQAVLRVTDAGTVVYGQTLTLGGTGGSGTGAVTYRIDTTHSTGEAVMDPNTGVLTPVKVGSVSVIATKAGDSDYNDVTSAPFVLMIQPATPTGAPGCTRITAGGGSTTTPAITVPVSSDRETVRVDASVSNGTATVKATERQLEQVAANTDTVTVDVSGLQNVHSAKLPASIVEKAEQSGAELTIALPAGSVTLDAAALAAVGSGRDVTVSVQQATLTDAQRAAVGSLAQVAVVVDVNVLTGTAKPSGFNGGKLTVSIPYALKSGEDPAKLQVWFIRGDGSIENKGGSYDRKTSCFVFSTEYLSRCLLVNTAGAQRFADVPASAYYAEAVAWAVNNGITGGTSAATFSPGANCTRAQIVTFIYRCMK